VSTTRKKDSKEFKGLDNFIKEEADYDEIETMNIFMRPNRT